jgi:hypothetical protein
MTNIEKPIEIGLQRVGNRWGGQQMKQRGSPSTFIAADFLMSFLCLKVLENFRVDLKLFKIGILL